MKVYLLITLIFSILLQNEALKFSISQAEKIQPKLVVENAQPRMTYIGQINGKNFFYEDIEVNKDGARIMCSNAGMELAYFESFAEFDHITTVGPSLTFYWTSAIHPNSLSYFKWEHDGSSIPSQNFAYFGDTEVGLQFFSYPPPSAGRTLRQSLISDNSSYPLCIARAKKEGNILEKVQENPQENPKITIEKIIPKRPVFESGPLPGSVKLANPRLEFIGEFNGRSFYIDEQLVGREESRAICANLGMQMGYLESSAEIDFVFENTPQSYFWVSGIKGYDESSLSYFQWENSDSVMPANIPFGIYGDTEFGLVFSGYVEEFPKHFIQTKLDFVNAMPLCFLLG